MTVPYTFLVFHDSDTIERILVIYFVECSSSCFWHFVAIKLGISWARILEDWWVFSMHHVKGFLVLISVCFITSPVSLGHVFKVEPHSFFFFSPVKFVFPFEASSFRSSNWWRSFPSLKWETAFETVEWGVLWGVSLWKNGIGVVPQECLVFSWPHFFAHLTSLWFKSASRISLYISW